MATPDIDEKVWGEAVDKAFQKVESADGPTLAERAYNAWIASTLYLVPTLGFALLAADSYLTEGKPALSSTLGAIWVLIGVCLNHQARQDALQRDIAYMQNFNETEF